MNLLVLKLISFRNKSHIFLKWNPNFQDLGCDVIIT